MICLDTTPMSLPTYRFAFSLLRSVMFLLSVPDLPLRPVLLWTSCVLYVFLLCQRPDHTFRTHTWISKLKRFLPTVRCVQYSLFVTSNVVYLKMPCSTKLRLRFSVATSFMYVGSSSNPLYKREAHRVAKFRQVTADKLVKAELSLRWWKAHSNFFDYV